LSFVVIFLCFACILRVYLFFFFYFFFSSRRRHTRSKRDWSSDVCSSDLPEFCQTILFSKKISICFSSFLLVSTDLRNHLVILLLSNLHTRRLNLDRFGRMLHLLCQHFIGRRRILIFSNPKLVLGICNLL